MNLKKLLSVMFFAAVAFAPTFAMANEGAAKDPFASLAAALAISVAAFGGALSQARIGAAALEGIARNPAAQGKIFVPMIIGLALVESLVLYAFVIAFVKI